MRRERIDADQALFSERLAGRPAGLRRSLARAAALAPHLGVDLAAWRARPQRVLIVVGSKGKGTAATYASATLAAAGLRVGTLTSPGLRSNRERIRVGGTAIDRLGYERLVGDVASTVRSRGPQLPDGGYLSPSGLFLLAAIRHFSDRGCDAVVLEAGMGGRSDEVALLWPGVVAITAVIEEHVGVLGDSVTEIAAEKAGVVTAATSALVSAPQPFAEADRVVVEEARRHGAELIRVDRTSTVPGDSELSPGLGRVNALAGVTAALRLLDTGRWTPPPPATLRTVLDGVQLPGRLSHHRLGSQHWIIDCATNPEAIAGAVAHATETMGRPTAVLSYVPRLRDDGPLLEAMGELTVVRVPGGSSTGPPGRGAVMHLDQVDLDALGPRVLAVGPAYFAGELLATLDVDCERSFGPPPPT
ncbi:MAG TPA: hypothetical protein VEK76_06380 [Candidatus Binatia bacterium]|nr:hypothetical protein [Candidatus Binatia bacterium]